MEYRNSWMYGSLRWKPDFQQEVNIFLVAAEKNSMEIKNIIEILCSCSDCKNYLAWSDVTVVRSHLIMRGFVKDYSLWIHHDETPVNVVEPREENMEEDNQTYLDKFIG
jgi:hypothetical protein